MNRILTQEDKDFMRITADEIIERIGIKDPVIKLQIHISVLHDYVSGKLTK